MIVNQREIRTCVGKMIFPFLAIDLSPLPASKAYFSDVYNNNKNQICNVYH